MRHFFKFVFGIALFLVFISCKEKQNTPKIETVVETTQEEGYIPKSWITNRVKKAEERLKTTEAGQVIWKGMEAHGGLQTWYENGPLALRFNYQPLDGSTQRDSYQVIDTWRNRAVHTSAADSTATYGWTGKTAWVKAKDSTFFKYDTKFWALTPLYLMGFPFVLDGEGVNLELLPNNNYKGKENHVVKVTFEPDTGDAPDDYYILQFDVDSHLLTATRYIVSYPEYFKKGEHLPEKFMEVGELVSIDRILLPNGLKTHWTKDNQPGEYLTKIDITDIHFKGQLDENFFAMPEGAKKL